MSFSAPHLTWQQISSFLVPYSYNYVQTVSYHSVSLHWASQLPGRETALMAFHTYSAAASLSAKQNKKGETETACWNEATALLLLVMPAVSMPGVSEFLLLYVTAECVAVPQNDRRAQFISSLGSNQTELCGAWTQGSSVGCWRWQTGADSSTGLSHRSVKYL